MATMLPAATPPPSSTPLAFRQYVTLTRPDLLQGRIVEYPPRLPAAAASSRPAPQKNETRSSNMAIPPPASPAPSRGALSASKSQTPVSPKKRLETLSLRRAHQSTRQQRTTQRLHGQTSSRKSDSIGQESSLPSQQSQASQRTTSSDVTPRMSKDSLNNASSSSSPVVVSVPVLVSKDVVVEEELSDEEIDRRRNIEKCMNWIEKLPAKFSSMHIAQERAPAANY